MHLCVSVPNEWWWPLAHHIDQESSRKGCEIDGHTAARSSVEQDEEVHVQLDASFQLGYDFLFTYLNDWKQQEGFCEGVKQQDG